MTSINKQINEMVGNMHDAADFIDKWINYLGDTPWADGECVFDNLRYENSLSWPIYFVQYETASVDEFRVESHTLWNENDKKPDIGFLKKKHRNTWIDTNV